MPAIARRAIHRWCRPLAALALVLALSPGLWWREVVAEPDPHAPLAFTALRLPSSAEQARHLGAFHLQAAWQIRSRNRYFGGYSALLPTGDHTFFAISDKGHALRLAAPRALVAPVWLKRLYEENPEVFDNYDGEGVTGDPETGRMWISWETTNAISRFGPGLRLEKAAAPVAMRDWGVNDGAESLVRLRDGRFIALREAFDGWLEDRRHEALLFPGDPVEGAQPARFSFSGSANFSPVDMAQLPDGRVLVLMRRMVWPMPFRFAGRIVIADPAAIRPGQVWQAREVAKLSSSLPIDNFEGLAIEPRGDGRVTVWLISDDNGAATQRTLLWEMVVDPREL